MILTDLAQDFEDIGEFKEGLAWVRREGKEGYVDEEYRLIIPYKYDFCGTFRGGIAAVMKDDDVIYINKQGTELFKLPEFVKKRWEK